MQTKKGSLTEAIINTCIGFIVTLLASPLIYWMCGVKMSGLQMGYATLLFTILSIARGYIVRRYFNKLIIKKINGK